MIGQYDYAVSWLKESLQRYHKEGHKTVTLEQILQYYVFASYKQGVMIHQNLVRHKGFYTILHILRQNICIGEFNVASELTQQLLQLMAPRGQTELGNIFDLSESQRAYTQKSTGQEDHSEDYIALCRYHINHAF